MASFPRPPDSVVASATEYGIIAVTARQGVVTITTKQCVVAVTTGNNITTTTAGQGVRTAIPDERVVLIGTNDVFDIAQGIFAADTGFQID